MTGPHSNIVHVIGAGLAGSEAAWQVAKAGVPVVLHEMRPDRMTEAHRTDGLAELVCSNSFRSDDAANNAVGLLHAEMRRLDSLIMRAADANQVPAGGALAVDRDGFSAAVTKALNDHPLIEISRGEVAGLPPADWSNVIVATGPLTSAPLADAIRELTDENALAFFDDRADRASRIHRHVGGLVPVALRQGRPRRHRRRLHQLPHDQGAV
jgi:methylenetetrahydrofolate--tRNA-(uracil-5-)-methyltransferase